MDGFIHGRIRHRRPILIASVLFAALFGALVCGHSASGSPRTMKTPYKTTGDEGRITGVVSVAGELPPPREISMAADPECEPQYRDTPKFNDIVVKNGNLANAFVYVQSAALERFEFEPTQTAPTLDMRKCRVVPHVLGMLAGQTLRFVNGDPTAHNPTVRAEKNSSFNKGLRPPEKDQEPSFFEKKLDEPEMPLVVRCNQHPWERSYLMVMPNPFFAVTDRNGAFLIEGLPPGDYEVVLWHERLKGRTVKVSVGRREFKDVNFTLNFPEDDKQSPAQTPQP